MAKPMWQRQGMLNDKRSYFRLKCVAKTRPYFSSLMLFYTGGLNLWIKKNNSPSRNLEKSGFNLSYVHTIPDSLFVSTRKLMHLKPTQPAQQAFPIELLRESQSESKKKVEKKGSFFFALVPVFQTNLARKRLLRRLKPTRKLIRYLTLHFRVWCVAALLFYRKRAGITVVMCEQKRYPVRFSYWRKIYPVECEHSLTLLRVDPQDCPRRGVNMFRG